MRATLESLVAAPPWTEAALEEAREVLPARVRKEFRRTRKLVRAAQGADRATQRDRDEAVHAARRAAKRLRYASEALEPVWGKDAKRLAKAAKRFAARLGTRQDAVVAGADLLTLAAAAQDAGESAFTYGRLHAREQQVADRIDREVDELWDRLARKKLRRWV